MSEIDVYAGIKCKGNPGPGGWGVVLLSRGRRCTLTGRAEHTTNNRMVLQAAVSALMQIRGRRRITLYSDSQYLIHGINEWLGKWRETDFQSAPNGDLWLLLDLMSSTHELYGSWAKEAPDRAFCQEAKRLASIGVAQ